MKISTLLREAYSAETALGPDVIIAKLKAENRALREELGLPAIKWPEREEDGDGDI